MSWNEDDSSSLRAIEDALNRIADALDPLIGTDIRSTKAAQMAGVIGRVMGEELVRAMTPDDIPAPETPTGKFAGIVAEKLADRLAERFGGEFSRRLGDEVTARLYAEIEKIRGSRS